MGDEIVEGVSNDVAVFTLFAGACCLLLLWYATRREDAVVATRPPVTSNAPAVIRPPSASKPKNAPKAGSPAAAKAPAVQRPSTTPSGTPKPQDSPLRAKPPPTKPTAVALSMLLNMGFSEPDCVAALAATGEDDADAALEWLAGRQDRLAEEEEAAAAAATLADASCQQDRAQRAVGYESNMAGIRSRQQRVSDMQSEDGRKAAAAQRQVTHLKRMEEYKSHVGYVESFPGEGDSLLDASHRPLDQTPLAPPLAPPPPGEHQQRTPPAPAPPPHPNGFGEPQLHPYDNGGYEAEEAARVESERDGDRLIRQQQDEEYEMALAIDRSKKEAGEAAANEITKPAPPAPQAPPIVLLDEPDASAPGGVSVITVRYPDGHSFRRRFLVQGSTVLDVFAAVRTLHTDASVAPGAAFDLATSHPRKLFLEQDEPPLSLNDAGLAPQALLFVDYHA